MSNDLSLASLGSLCAVDVSHIKDMPQPAQIKLVSKAMESVFTSQLVSEMGKGLESIGGSKESGPYSDFIQQAMTQGLTNGSGMGLAKAIEGYLTKHNPHTGAPLTPSKHGA